MSLRPFAEAPTLLSLSVSEASDALAGVDWPERDPDPEAERRELVGTDAYRHSPRCCFPQVAHVVFSDSPTLVVRRVCPGGESAIFQRFAVHWRVKRKTKCYFALM